MRKLALLILPVAFCHPLLAQSDSISISDSTRHAATSDSLPTGFAEDLLENFAQNQEDETPFDYNFIFDDLEHLRRQPLDLNLATAADLDELPFLSEFQKRDFLAHRENLGGLLSIFELQAIPGFDLATIRQMLPFVKVDEPGILEQGIFSQEAKNQLFLRWSRTLQEAVGYAGLPKDSTGTGFLGDRNRLYLRYRYSSANISAGLTAEKDAGEEFLSGSNRHGFDFYSAHFFLKNPSKRLKAIALGDFSVSLGQGLILWQGFASRKSALATLVSKNGRALRPYSSVSEYDFFRGAGATVAFWKHLEFTAFASTRRRDANSASFDELPQDPDFQADDAYLTTLQLSGLHRTKAEIEDEKAVRQTSFGGSLQLKKRRWHVGLNALSEHLSKPLQPLPKVYNRFYFAGNQLFNMSFDYAFTHRNFFFFGETASSQNGSLATLNGVLIALDRTIDVALVHRHFPKNYQALNPKPFAETSGAKNESGAYLGIAAQPATRWRVNAYFDVWKHRWATFNASLPSAGHEWFGRLTYERRRKMEAYFQIKTEVKEEDADLESGNLPTLVERKNVQTRLHFSYKLTPEVELRSRIEAGFSEKEGVKSKGSLLSQDLIFKGLGSPVSFGARLAIFDTDGYAIRFYNYENDLMNDYSIPAYFDRGVRFYLNCRWRINRHWMLEGRYANTRYANSASVGTGLDEIPKPVKSEVKMQVRWQF